MTGEQPVAWPPRGNTPSNEFHSEGYITQLSSLLGPVSLGYNVRHLTMYSDGRFARHPRFRYMALKLKYAGVLYKLVKSTFVNTLWKSCVIWLVHPFPVVSVTMLAL